jgi:hypothetical protein
MNELAQPDMKSNDEPLFVLKYQGYKVTIRVLCWAFAGLFIGLFFFGVVMQRASGFEFLLAAILGPVVVVGAVAVIVQTAFFKEVRLYTDSEDLETYSPDGSQTDKCKTLRVFR